MEEGDKARRRAFMRRLTRISRISWRDLAATLGPMLLLSIAVILVALHFVRPAPPDTITLTAGPEGSAFARAADKYAAILKRNGITLRILPSKGSLENLDRLKDPTSAVDVGFVQSGVARPEDIGDLVSLGSVFYEPVTVFYHCSRKLRHIRRLSQFKGLRIAIGPEGSGTRFLALALLKGNGIEPGGPTQLVDIGGTDAIEAFDSRKVDVVFLSGDSAAVGSIRKLLHTRGVKLFEFAQAEGYVRRYRYLSALDIPEGAFDLGDDLPAHPIKILAPTVELVARPDLHPALSDLLIEAARQVHGRATLLQNAGEFPAPLEHDFPISDDAARYYKSGKGFAYRYLPFWLASLASRILVVLVPVVVLVIPGLRVVPALYGWRINSRIYRRYGEMMALERASLDPMDDEQRAELLQRIGAIEKDVIALKMPGAYASQLYVLREHIAFVRKRLAAVSP